MERIIDSYVRTVDDSFARFRHSSMISAMPSALLGSEWPMDCRTIGWGTLCLSEMEGGKRAAQARESLWGSRETRRPKPPSAPILLDWKMDDDERRPESRGAA